MSFNKGDFTQQGIAGHVNANLRLNEKRLVNIDMTSNEEAEGCTIAGTVTDLLNDKVYNIGSGVSGNIEITENGENINVAPYATATVNVSGGGGGGETPRFTINSTNETTYTATWDIGAHYDKDMPNVIDLEGLILTANSNETYTVPFMNMGESMCGVLLGWANFGDNVTYSYADLVNCTYDDSEEPVLLVTDPAQNASATVNVILKS